MRLKKVIKEMPPRFAAAARCPALLDWSGGCGTRATRSDNPRRHPLTSLRYSAALRGRKAETQKAGGQQVAHPLQSFASGCLRQILLKNSLLKPSWCSEISWCDDVITLSGASTGF